MGSVRRLKTLGAFARLSSLTAFLAIGAGIAASPSVAWERDADVRAVPWDRRFLLPPAPRQDPVIPALAGGVVGPALDAKDAHAGDALPGGRQAPLVPPPAETWEQKVLDQVHLTGRTRSYDLDGERSRHGIGIALGLVAVIGTLAAMAAVLGANQRAVPSPPPSILGDLPTGTRHRLRPGGGAAEGFSSRHTPP